MGFINQLPARVMKAPHCTTVYIYIYTCIYIYVYIYILYGPFCIYISYSIYIALSLAAAGHSPWLLLATSRCPYVWTLRRSLGSWTPRPTATAQWRCHGCHGADWTNTSIFCAKYWENPLGKSTEIVFPWIFPVFVPSTKFLCSYPGLCWQTFGLHWLSVSCFSFFWHGGLTFSLHCLWQWDMEFSGWWLC